MPSRYQRTTATTGNSGDEYDEDNDDIQCKLKSKRVATYTLVQKKHDK